MAEHDPTARRLAAILFTDIVGYTALMGRDEAAGRRVRERHEAVVQPLVARYQGEWVEERGDESLSIFPSALDAVNSALAIQQALADDPELKLRIGIHSGDVTFERGRVIGDGVNVASRIRALAEPGGICITGEVWQTIRNQPNVETAPLGERELRNVDRPVAVYAVSGTAVEPAVVPKLTGVLPRKASLGRWVATAIVVVVIAGLAQSWWRTRHPESAPARSVGVLLFDNLGRDAANEAFTDGIHDDILTQISKIRDLKVIARTTMERLDPTLSIQEIGSRLGVATVLEGGVQRVEDRVRINVQLVDCETEAHLWAETYNRELTATNIFAIQSEISASVADALHATLSPEEQERLTSIPTESLAAYQAYLVGKQRMAKRTTIALAECVDYFQQAIEHDPGFALAYVGLADAYTYQVHVSGLPPEETLAKAQAAVDKALELDDQLGEAYNSLAGIKEEGGDFEGAEPAYHRALKLNPNYATTYHWYAFLQRTKLGRPEEALEMNIKAVELDPLSGAMIGDVADVLQILGRFEEALDWYKRAVEVDPGYVLIHFDIGVHYWGVLGQLDEAAVSFAKAISLDPDNPDFPVFLGWLFLDLGDPGKAEYWIHRSIELGPESYWPNVSMQLLHLYQGDEAAAVDYGRKAFAAGPVWSSSWWDRVGLLRDHELRVGRYTEARALYEQSHRELLNEDVPKVDNRNYRAAIDLALVLSKTGEQERADLLLDRSFQHIRTMPRLGSDGHMIADVLIYALRGDKQKALAALRQAIDDGWRVFWWYFLMHDPNLESLRGEPEFQAMVEEIETDMAAQLARVREMERNGELVFPTELPAPRDRAMGSPPRDLQ